MKFVTIIGVEDVRFLLEGDFARFGHFGTIHCFEEDLCLEEEDLMVEWMKSLLLLSLMMKSLGLRLLVLEAAGCFRCWCDWCWSGCLDGDGGESGCFHHLYH